MSMSEVPYRRVFACVHSHLMLCFQGAGRALGSVFSAHPERMARTLVVNAPMWFNFLWKLVSPYMHENSRAKVEVCIIVQTSLMLCLVGADAVAIVCVAAGSRTHYAV